MPTTLRAQVYGSTDVRYLNARHDWEAHERQRAARHAGPGGPAAPPTQQPPTAGGGGYFRPSRIQDEAKDPARPGEWGREGPVAVM